MDADDDQVFHDRDLADDRGDGRKPGDEVGMEQIVHKRTHQVADAATIRIRSSGSGIDRERTTSQPIGISDRPKKMRRDPHRRPLATYSSWRWWRHRRGRPDGSLATFQGRGEQCCAAEDRDGVTIPNAVSGAGRERVDAGAGGRTRPPSGPGSQDAEFQEDAGAWPATVSTRLEDELGRAARS